MCGVRTPARVNAPAFAACGGVLTPRARAQAKLEHYLPAATDSVLCDYVLVMVGNKKTSRQVAIDLEAFLSPDEAEEFVTWLWELLSSVERQDDCGRKDKKKGTGKGEARSGESSKSKGKEVQGMEMESDDEDQDGDAPLATLSFVPCGKGVRTYPDGSRYDGHWKEGRWHGKGSYDWPSDVDNRPRYEGDFKDGHLHGSGVLTWADGDRFLGQFRLNAPEKGLLEKKDDSLPTLVLQFDCESNLKCPNGHVLQNSQREAVCDVCDGNSDMSEVTGHCSRCDYDVCTACQTVLAASLCDLITNPKLPECSSQRQIGRISARLWAAIEAGAADCYSLHANLLNLSLADRIQVMSLHVSENASSATPRTLGTASRREALKVTYQNDTATEEILKALSSADAPGKMQWAIEVEKCSDAAAAAAEPRAVAAMTRAAMTCAELRAELERRGLDTKGNKVPILKKCPL